MKLKDIILPTIPKIFLYGIFFFLSPTFFKDCTSGACHYSFKFLAGLRLAQQTKFDITIPMFFLLLSISYLLSCLLIAGFNYLKEKRMTLS
ncbi:MAG: hypothetical protein U9Q69_01580 [Nanoarchaeota archaeon]|nr:hypothetical protein [Nanoarchaeota archaeon]